MFTEAALLPYRLNEFTFQDDVVRRNFERIVRPGKKLAQRKAVGRHGAMGRKEFLLEVMGLEVGAQGRVVWKGRVVFS